MELFKVGFINVTLIDVIDILIVTYIFYKLYLVMRGTIAAQIFVGLTLIVVISLIAQTFNMRSLGWLFSRLTDIWVIAFIMLFQPEIRRVLLVLCATIAGLLLADAAVTVARAATGRDCLFGLIPLFDLFEEQKDVRIIPC